MSQNVPSIKVFSIDYKKSEKQWDLPYIRLGTGKLHDAVLADSIGENLLKYDLALSEGTAIWWVWKHLAEFGKTDYIGFCHYRRFFSHVIQQPVLDISKNQFKSDFCMTPEQQLAFMMQNGYDMIAPYPLLGFSPEQAPFDYIWESFLIQSGLCDWGLNETACKLPFELMLDGADENLKPHIKAAFKQKPVHFCSIFTCRRDLFEIYCRHVFPACIKTLETIPACQQLDFHPRWMGCVLERMTSCMIYAFRSAGYSVANVPLLTVATNDPRPFDHKKNRDLPDNGGVYV